MLKSIFLNRYNELRGIWAGILIGFFLILATVIILAPFFFIDSVSCNNRYPNLEHTYRVSSGCLILVDGNYIPEENFIFNTPQ